MAKRVCGQDNRLRWFQPAADRQEKPPRAAAPVRLALLGPPGVGKGTQAAMICGAYRACHLATGDLFRAAGDDATPSPAMADALGAMRRGDLVSDDVVTRLVRERSACLACGGGFLLDGYPRTVSQAESLTGLLGELNLALNGVVLYELDEASIAERLGGRRTCSGCKAVYHTTARPPQRPGLCDTCGGELIQREDDRPDVIRTRFAAYREATEPVRDYYAARGELLTVPGDGVPEAVFEQTRTAIDTRLAAGG